jgi:type II secretory pathway component PulF
VTAAMLYPCVLLFLALAVLVFLLTFFIPKFQVIFKGLGAALPLPTQIVLGASHVLRSYGLLVVIGIAIVGMLVRNWFASEKGRRVWEGLIIRTPLIGPLVAQFAMARFCRMLGTLLGAGVPLVQGLNVARKSIGNQILVDAVSSSIERVQQGGQLGASLAECKGLFPSSVLEMVSVAEESGKLDQELIRIANVTEGDLDRQLKTAVAFAEPLLLFFIAAFIGTIFISMVLPIFTMQEYIK